MRSTKYQDLMVTPDHMRLHAVRPTNHDPESEGKYCTLSSSRQKKPIPLPSVELDSCTFLYCAPSVAAVSKVRTFGSEVSPYRG